MSKELPRWVVSRIQGAKNVYLTTVSAKDAEAAISTAIQALKITDREAIKRMAARPG
jgi:hypothetical protein